IPDQEDLLTQLRLKHAGHNSSIASSSDVSFTYKRSILKDSLVSVWLSTQSTTDDISIIGRSGVRMTSW
ncbi:MAG: hypothetical protein PHS96_12795, partial [Anaerolineales bacterium]|nr:hypothetical protein [Anaerolineales bacterium]